MYISEIQKRLMNAIESSSNTPGCLALAVNHGANPSEMTDTYHLALWFEGAPKDVKGKLVTLLELSGINEIGLRICHNCGKFFTEGYILGGMDFYACSDKCAVAYYGTEKDLEEALEYYPDDNFWTEWYQEL